MLDVLRRWLFGPGRAPEGAARPPETGAPSPVSPRVLLLNIDPPAPEAGGRRLSRVLGWGDADQLTERFIADLEKASGGYCRYQVAARIEVPDFPAKIDGFAYTASQYLAAWRARRGFHEPDRVDYLRLLEAYDVAARVAASEIDEVWLFGFPYAGFHESCMLGPDAFWCNAPPLEGYEWVGRRFIVMGFNYERGVGEMLEAYGHRVESIMAHVMGRQGGQRSARRGSTNLWERFIRHEKSHPGQAEVGTVHYAPNSERDYDWGNPRPVLSRCDNWYRFPDLSGPPRQVDAREWGGGDTRRHHLWWLAHLPRAAGSSEGLAHNWWQYVVDPNLAP